jgi:hypothetical protein
MQPSETEIKALLDVLTAAERYCDPGRHAFNCEKGKGMSWESYPCTCGLDALRAAIKAVPKRAAGKD